MQEHFTGSQCDLRAMLCSVIRSALCAQEEMYVDTRLLGVYSLQLDQV